MVVVGGEEEVRSVLGGVEVAMGWAVRGEKEVRVSVGGGEEGVTVGSLGELPRASLTSAARLG